MRLSLLSHLRCPAPPPGSRRPCGGRLAERSDELPARSAVDEPDELLEGELACDGCGARYPVLGGVAILVADPLRYLGRRFHSLVGVAALHADLSRQALDWIERLGVHRFELAPQRDSPDSSAVLHYERPARLLEDVPLPAGFRAFVAEADGGDPYDVLADMAGRSGAGDRRLALDVGCGVGGLVQRLADRYELALGADLSFSSVLLARSILLGRPRPYRHRIHLARDVLEPSSLAAAARRNVEVVVADGTALPFAEGAFDAVASANVLEVVVPPAMLREATRILAPAGLLLLTDPFKFRFGEPPSASGSRLDDARAELRAIGLAPVEERDFVPWIWYRYRRQCQIFFNYCGAWSRSPEATLDRRS